MNIAHWLAGLLSQPSPPPPGGFINEMPEAFGALDEHGEVFVIGYRGDWFHPTRPSLRVRLHNWLIRERPQRGPDLRSTGDRL